MVIKNNSKTHHMQVNTTFVCGVTLKCFFIVLLCYENVFQPTVDLSCVSSAFLSHMSMVIKINSNTHHMQVNIILIFGACMNYSFGMLAMIQVIQVFNKSTSYKHHVRIKYDSRIWYCKKCAW